MIRLHVYILQENLLLIGFSEKFLKIYKTIPEMEVLKHPFIVKDYRTLKDKEQCFFSAFMKKIHLSYHCTKNFLFHKKISSINVSKSAGNCGCIFVQCISSLTDVCKFQLDERALLELCLIFFMSPLHYQIHLIFS